MEFLWLLRYLTKLEGKTVPVNRKTFSLQTVSMYYWNRLCKHLIPRKIQTQHNNLIKSNRHLFKGIVSRDFEWLQMILMNRSWVPDVPLVVYYCLNFRFHIVFKFLSFEWVKLLLMGGGGEELCVLSRIRTRNL